MHLKELRINGFKSFADKTRLELDPGVTAIVGPNGCGKSNIADAIRWALGEQSSKSMRAGSMQDVIFQGTDSRKPVSLCEVSLTFANCEERLGAAYNEVEICRRVVRDGGSEYSLNGKACRLKDIQRLFLDTGVGQVSYSFMLQGQIDKILSSNPSERRVIFEEAAGISKYKAQRREALGKLQQVETNLNRVTDVIEEVARRFSSLKRQAGKALRYKRIRHRLTHIDLACKSHRLDGLRSEAAELEAQASGRRVEVKRLQERLSGRESELSEKKQARAELAEKLQGEQKTVYDLRAERENAENQSELAQMRAEDARKRIQQLNAELERLSDQKKELSERAKGESSAKKEQLDLFDNTDQVFRQKSEEVSSVQEKLSDAEMELQESKQQLLMSESGVSRHRSTVAALEIDLKECEVKRAGMLEEAQNLKSSVESLENSLEEIRKAQSLRAEDKAKADSGLAEARERVSKAQSLYREAQTQIQKADREAASLIAQIGVLEGLQQKLEGFGEGAKAILKGKLNTLQSETDDEDAESRDMPSAARALAGLLKTDPRHTLALETLLGQAADAVLLGDTSKSKSVAEELQSRSLGRATLALPGKSPTAATFDNPPDFLIPFSNIVSTEDEAAGRLLPSLLAGCWLCEDMSAFLDWWSQRPDADFLMVVSPDGQACDRRGLLFAGQSKGGSESYLSRQEEIRRLKTDQEKMERSLEGFRKEAAKHQQALDDAEQQVEERRARLVELAEEISTLKAQQQNAQESIEQNNERINRSGQALEQLEASRTDARQRLEEARLNLSKAESAIEERRMAVATAEEKAIDLREERDKKREMLSEARLQIAEKRQRLEMLDKGIQQLESQCAEIAQLAVRRQQEADTLAERCDELKEESERHLARKAEIEKSLAGVMRTLEGDREAHKTLEKAIEEMESSMSGERSQREEQSEALSKLEIRLSKTTSSIEFLKDETWREHELDIADVGWKTELWKAGDELPERIRVDVEEESPEDVEADLDRGEPTDEDLEDPALESPDWAALTEEVDALRGRLGSMGPVNLVAIDEYKELKERHGFLKTQSEDLWKSKNELIKAIDEINTASLEMFRNTFDQVRKNFTYTFDTLFGGGESDLVLTEADDPLESGVDIVARPPGTRLKNLALLSGGQKTMTAVALLFAIYMVKPSPFCVLDELDAPLDDANIGRFCEMLKSFLEYSQFLIITHNKRTISNADMIFGVTMQEKGVSKLISMRFNKGEEKVEAVSAEPAQV